MKEESEQAAAVLIGLPLADVGRAANMSMFRFGKLVSALDRQGNPAEVAEYNLHVQCHWRIVAEGRIVVGSRDMYYAADASTAIDDDSFEWDEPGANLCDVRVGALVKDHESSPLIVQSILADEVGGLRISFTEGFTLDLFLDTSWRKNDAGEHWRLFGQTGSHFVVTQAGIET